jgi:signal recognition particle receptor subunit beta
MELKKKENKTELEWDFIRYYKAIATISEIMISNEKFDLSDKDAVEEIRKYLKNNF